jgi:hypothetical protein
MAEGDGLERDGRGLLAGERLEALILKHAFDRA